MEKPTRPSKGINTVELHTFYTGTILALEDWEERIRGLLQRKQLGNDLIHMRYGSQELPVGVATYSELVSQVPQILNFLGRAVLITAVANFEAFLENKHRQFLSQCPKALGADCGTDQQIIEEDIKKNWRLTDRLKRLERLAEIDYTDAPASVDRKAVLEIVSTRNLQLHNQGYVDKKYEQQFPESRVRTGQLRPVTPIYVNDSLWCLEEFSAFIEFKFNCRLAKLKGETIPIFQSIVGNRGPKQGRPRKVRQCWCICPRGDANGPRGIVGIAAEWARRGLLPGGDEIALCTFEVEPQNLLPQPGLVEIMPPLNTLMAEVDERVKDRLKIQKVAWQNTDTLRKVLKEHNIWVQDNE